MHIHLHLRTIALPGSHRLISSKISLGCVAGPVREGRTSTWVRDGERMEALESTKQTWRLTSTYIQKWMNWWQIFHAWRCMTLAIDILSSSLVNQIQFFFVSWSLWKYWEFVIVTRPPEPVASQAPCVATYSPSTEQTFSDFFSRNFQSLGRIFFQKQLQLSIEKTIILISKNMRFHASFPGIICDWHHILIEASMSIINRK